MVCIRHSNVSTEFNDTLGVMVLCMMTCANGPAYAVCDSVINLTCQVDIMWPYMPTYDTNAADFRRGIESHASLRHVPQSKTNPGVTVNP